MTKLRVIAWPVMNVPGFVMSSATPQLALNFYNSVCPQALPTIKAVVKFAVKNEPSMGASLLRLHFHDCFVHGCDTSKLLDQTSTIESEKFALPNNNSSGGFEVIDRIKAKLDRVCGCPVVSCADILAVTARDSVVARIARRAIVERTAWENRLEERFPSTGQHRPLPGPFMDLPALKNSFVALSGAHTIGYAQSRVFRNPIYNDTNIEPSFANYLQRNCACTAGQTDSNLAPLDPTAARFDTLYYNNLVNQKGLMHSDQALLSGKSTNELVKMYNSDHQAFSRQFAKSMIKMGNIRPLTGNKGEIRRNCHMVN